MIIATKTLPTMPAKARTNTINIDKPLADVAAMLHCYLQKKHPQLRWHWEPAPSHPSNTRFEDRLNIEREIIYTSIFQMYDAADAQYLNWRRVRQANADWLLCAAYTAAAKVPHQLLPPPITSLSKEALVAWTELLCLWLIILDKPNNAAAWSAACGPGAAWFVGLISNKTWSSAFRVNVHVVSDKNDCTELAIVLTEKHFINASQSAINPATRVGPSALLAWSNMFLGRKIPVRIRRAVFDVKTKTIWRTKWPYYNAMADALLEALTAAAIAPKAGVFCATHLWVDKKISSTDLPVLPAVNIIDLSFPHDPISRNRIEQEMQLYAPKPIAASFWSAALPPMQSTTTATLVVQPCQTLDGSNMHCWYMDASGLRQWVETKEMLPKFNSAALPPTVDPYSQYKLGISAGSLDTKATQAIGTQSFNKNAWKKTMRELLIQAWWISRDSIVLSDCQLQTQDFHVWHLKINSKKGVGMVCITIHWDAFLRELNVTNIYRNRFPNIATYQKQFPSQPARTGWWLEDIAKNRLEIATETPDGFVLRGDKHTNLASLLSCIAVSKGPRTADPGKKQKLISDEVLSRSAEAQLLPYYTNPGCRVAKVLHKDVVYLEEEGQRLRVFVPPYGPLESLDGFRQFRVVRLWDDNRKTYATWDLSTAVPDLLYWYLRTLTWDVLQVEENSQMSMLEKMAQECQI